MENIFRTRPIARIMAITFGLVASPAMLLADDVTLTFFDSSLTLKGEFIGFVEFAYVIDYNGDDLHVPAALVSCEGDSCFSLTMLQSTVLASNAE